MEKLKPRLVKRFHQSPCWEGAGLGLHPGLASLLSDSHQWTFPGFGRWRQGVGLKILWLIKHEDWFISFSSPISHALHHHGDTSEGLRDSHSTSLGERCFRAELSPPGL